MTGRSLEDIQDEILDALHGGEPIDRAAFLARYPEHADALRRFFDLVAVIETPAEPKPAQPSRLGEFEIIRELGRGGMGVVYEARQASLNRKVALKVLPPAMRQDRRLLARFQREAEAAARLRHPNIVPVYSIGESAGAPFFAMELVEGRSLAEIIKLRKAGDDAGLPKAGPDYRRWAVATAARIADALDYAHGRGILHRDIKPGNIILDSDGTPRLTDFGLALDLQASELTQTGESFGSPLYMSPEQAFRREAPVDARTDIYSLAVTLYELLMLRLPYHGTTHAELMSALSSGVIVAPRLADPDCPEPLERVLVQALRSDPHDRYATAGAFAVDLRASLERPQDVRAVAAEPTGGEGGPAGLRGLRGLRGLQGLRGLKDTVHEAAAEGEWNWTKIAGITLLGVSLLILVNGGSIGVVVLVAIAGFIALKRARNSDDKQPAGPDEPAPPARRGRWNEWRRERPLFSGMAVGCGCLVVLILGLAMISALLLSGERDRSRSAFVYETPSKHGVARHTAALERFRTLAVPCDLSLESLGPDRSIAPPRAERLADYPSPLWPPLLGGPSYGIPDADDFEEIAGNDPGDADDLGVAFIGPLEERYASRDPQILLCSQGIAAEGGVTAKDSCTLLVGGQMAGRCVFDDYATLIVDGDLTGSVQANSHVNAVVAGDLSGHFTAQNRCLLYVQGRLTGTVEFTTGGRIFIAGRMERAELIERISGSADVLVGDSDLEPGTTTSVGRLTVTVVARP